MNMRKQFSGIVFLILSALALFPAQAEEEHQNLPASIEKRLQSFDPAVTMIAALEVLTKDELIALDQFYSSPVGQSVLSKMPQVMNSLPAMMQVVIRAKLKAKGMDLRL
jgi:hypothetical protein